MDYEFNEIITGKIQCNQEIYTFFEEKNPYDEIDALYVKAIIHTDLKPLEEIISKNEGKTKVLVLPFSFVEKSFYMSKGINLNANTLAQIRNIYKDVSFLYDDLEKMFPDIEGLII